MLTAMLKIYQRAIFFIVSCAAVFWTAGCAHQPTPSADGLPGFWSGLLHGFLIVFSFIGSLFTDVRIYNFPNSGCWYDFGFLLGAAMFLGGAASASSSDEHLDKIAELEEQIEQLKEDSEDE